MDLVQFFRLLLKHKRTLIVVPLFMGVIVFMFTQRTQKTYYSETVVFSGLSSQTSIEMDKSLNHFTTNIEFDNLINIMTSRDTREEVAIRLLSSHMLLKSPNPEIISASSYQFINESIPKEIFDYVKAQQVSGSPTTNSSGSFEAIVTSLTALKDKDNSNVVYEFLNSDHPFYSIKAISTIKPKRVFSSDLLKIGYQSEDPGICKQTLEIYYEVCSRKYKYFKENGSDAVVRYFQEQLKKSKAKLKILESEILEVNKKNNIINYYEQSKAVAFMRENMYMNYHRTRAQLAGSKAKVDQLEEKLAIQELIQLKRDKILSSKKEVSELDYQIVLTESKLEYSNNTSEELEALKKKKNVLNEEIKAQVAELYNFENTTEGIPIKKVLPEWIDEVVLSKDLEAKIGVLDLRNADYEKEYANYAPTGSTLKQIQREIDVAEQEYLQILHGLNIAKIKFQDTQLSQNLQILDPPFFPIDPLPSKRLLVIVGVMLLSFILILMSVLLLNFFDKTLKSSERASSVLELPVLATFPKIISMGNRVDLSRIQNRILQLFMVDLNEKMLEKRSQDKPLTIVITSTQSNEGKSYVAENIARYFLKAGTNTAILTPRRRRIPRTYKKKSNIVLRALGYNNSGSDYSNLFLQDALNFLAPEQYIEYDVNNDFYMAKSPLDLIPKNTFQKDNKPQCVIVELPNLLAHNYPVKLCKQASVKLLVCRANRLWTTADTHVLDRFRNNVDNGLGVVLNGTSLDEIEKVLGEIPMRRTNTRRFLKRLLRFQFRNNNSV